MSASPIDPQKQSSQSSSLHSNIQSTEANSQLNTNSQQTIHSYRSLNTERSTSRLPSSNLLIWGTTIKISTVIDSFKRFITNYTQSSLPSTDTPPFYKSKLEEAILREDQDFVFDLSHVYAFDSILYFQIIKYPLEMMKALDKALMELVEAIREENPAWPVADSFSLQSRPFGAKFGVKSQAAPAQTEAECLTIRDLNPAHIDTLVTIKGLVVRVSGLIPDLLSASYKCELCGRSQVAEVTREAVLEPRECANEFCKERNCLSLDSVASLFGNKQIVKIQEAPESIPKGETPLHCEVTVHDSLVDNVRPGDRVEVTGVYRIKGSPLSSRRREVSSLYRTFLDAVAFLRPDESSLSNSGSRKLYQELAKKGNIRELLLQSLAPTIYGMEEAKLGLLCLLFGGSSRGGAKRAEIHVILCGDPGTSKSQLLKQVHALTPRGVYTSGKGSSAVGLTAHVTKNADSGEMLLESGALVLADRGVCSIDEFDKMSDTAKTILHEAMEQQTVSLAKAGIVCTLHARTSILAAANPKESRYNPKYSIIKNLQMPPSLLSRFDLVFLVLDKADEVKDGELGSHLLNLYASKTDKTDKTDNEKERGEEGEGLLSREVFKGYIEYARENVHPVLSEEAEERAVQAYLELRNLGSTYNKNVITATPRQLESLLRLAEALAKMRLSGEVTREDVEEALRLVKVSTHTAATDPKTGLVDIDLLVTGRSATDRESYENNMQAVKDLIDEAKENGREKLKLTTLKKMIEDKSDSIGSISSNELIEVLKHLEMEDEIKVEVTGNNTSIILN